VLFVLAAAALTFFSTAVGRQALIDEEIRSVESFGRRVSDAQYDRLEQTGSRAAYFVLAGQLVGLPLAALVIAGAATAAFRGSGAGRFRQAFAVVVHSSAIIALQQLVVLPLDYMRQTLSSPTNLAAFVPFLDDSSFAARLVGTVDLFIVWWMVNAAVGLSVVFRRRPGRIALVMAAAYVAIALIVAVVKTMLAGAA
jgi:hypothetical protein